MQQPAREIVGVRRDAGGQVTHVVGRNEDGSRWVEVLETVLAAADSGRQAFFVTRGHEALLVTFRKNAHGLEATAAVYGGAIELPDVEG